jgi:hypothetical protein
MHKIILSIFLILFLIPSSQIFSQEFYDNALTLSVSLGGTPYVYQDSEGYAVVVGMVENNDSFTPVSNVQIQVNFFDDFSSESLETIEGTSILDVIPSNGKSPYEIRSQIPNTGITQASVILLGFDSSVEKQKELLIHSSDVFLSNFLSFSGVLQNGNAINSDTKIHLAYYDGFAPPRIIGVSTIDIGDIEPNSDTSFEINEKIDVNSKGFLLFTESDIFYSDVIDVILPFNQSMIKLVTISDVIVTDSMNNRISEIKLDSTINIESETLIKFTTDQKSNEINYTYYVQIKESVKKDQPPYVEYIGQFNGQFIGIDTEFPSIDWIPEKKGIFFIETFVWDKNNIPISEQGPFVLILVN